MVDKEEARKRAPGFFHLLVKYEKVKLLKLKKKGLERSL